MLIIEYTKLISDNPIIFDNEYDVDVLKVYIRKRKLAKSKITLTKADKKNIIPNAEYDCIDLLVVEIL